MFELASDPHIYIYIYTVQTNRQTTRKVKLKCFVIMCFILCGVCSLRERNSNKTRKASRRIPRTCNTIRLSLLCRVAAELFSPKKRTFLLNQNTYMHTLYVSVYNRFILGKHTHTHSQIIRVH